MTGRVEKVKEAGNRGSVFNGEKCASSQAKGFLMFQSTVKKTIVNINLKSQNS